MIAPGLAVDPGVRTGWARDRGRTGTLDLSKITDHGQALAMFEDWLDIEIRRERPLFLAVERAIFSGGRRMSATADLTVAIMMSAHAVAWSHDLPRRELTAAAVRSAVGGSVRATDRDMQPRVAASGFHTRISHEIDAAALLVVASSPATLGAAKAAPAKRRRAA